MKPKLKTLICRVTDSSLSVTFYKLSSRKTGLPLRLLLISDLHSCNYGRRQAQLTDKIDRLSPDIVLFAGDIADVRHPFENAKALAEHVGSKYRGYYVSGNHEIREGTEKKVKSKFLRCGMTVLEGNCHPEQIRGQKINICGVDDPLLGEQVFLRQLKSASQSADSQYYTLLLSHRPERFPVYSKYGFDLALCGHAHGGQWRLPGILKQGLYAPNQGLLPRYTCGVHESEDAKMVVCRGLARESTRLPRIFNPPELVVIDLLPADSPAKAKTAQR